MFSKCFGLFRSIQRFNGKGYKSRFYFNRRILQESFSFYETQLPGTDLDPGRYRNGESRDSAPQADSRLDKMQRNNCLLGIWCLVRGGELGGVGTRREGLQPLEHQKRLSGGRDLYLVTKYIIF